MDGVILSEQAREKMLASALEIYNKKARGYTMLSRRRNNGNRVVKWAHPLQTTRHGKRAERVLSSLSKAERRNGGLGGFHSRTKGRNKLGKPDMKYVQKEMEYVQKEMEKLWGYGIELNDWLEILLFIRKRENTTPKESMWDYPKKSRMTVKMFEENTWIGYDITFSAYWVFDENKKLRKKEVGLYFPEFL